MIDKILFVACLRAFFEGVVKNKPNELDSKTGFRIEKREKKTENKLYSTVVCQRFKCYYVQQMQMLEIKPIPRIYMSNTL